ncbi:DUF485 domain-containing protein, partial [Nocardioides plantarum]|uniref:DUF485 domain-containing protein n=1 Tax=Nocardioides plantarum TaxID=29299 RepID=UPI003614BE99
PQDSPPPPDMAARHDPIYETLHASDDFADCGAATAGSPSPRDRRFLAWFLLYVVLSNWATGFMSHRLFGNINVALVFGLLQFLTTFGIAYLYSRYSIAKLDPLSEKLEARFEKERSRG